MRMARPGHIEAVGILEAPRVAICRAKEECHRLRRLHRAAADVHVARGDAAGGVDGRLVAKRFLDHGADQLWIRLELGAFPGIEQQKSDRIADQVGGGEVAAHQQRRQIYAQFDVADGRALCLQPRHVGD